MCLVLLRLNFPLCLAHSFSLHAFCNSPEEFLDTYVLQRRDLEELGVVFLSKLKRDFVVDFLPCFEVIFVCNNKKKNLLVLLLEKKRTPMIERLERSLVRYVVNKKRCGRISNINRDNRTIDFLAGRVPNL